MNLKFSNKESDEKFCDALYESTVVRNWLVQKLSSYNNINGKVTLEIGIDPWTKTEKTSYNWAIYTEETDEYGIVAPGKDAEFLINGGLIHRGEENYSSHT